MNVHNSKERERFWEAYRGCAEENRVRLDRSPFYVKWAKDFDGFLRDKPLEDRSRKDIEAFLTDLRKRRCRHYHDLHPRIKQAWTLSKEPGGYLKKVKNNDMVQLPGHPASILLS